MVDWLWYSKKRQGLNYYKKIKKKILDFSPAVGIIDVGPGGTDLVLTGEFLCRCVVNKEPMPGITYKNTHVIIDDWLNPNLRLPCNRFDVVLCCQVLEHLTDEQIPLFVDKLLEVSKGGTLIISVPYQWPVTECEYHKQDPVDLDKLIGWIGIIPTNYEIVKDGRVSRLIAVFTNIQR